MILKEKIIIKELNVIKNENDVLLVDSREVASMIGKRHSDLLRSIKGCVDVLEANAELRSGNFFIESSYINR